MSTVTVRKPRRKAAPAPPPPPPVEVDRALATAEEYWSETRRPFPCLLFLSPLLIAYEVAVLWIGGREELLRNGADAWMRAWLYTVGIHESFALPIVVMALLLVWNFYGYFTWKVRPETLAGMLAESLIFAFALVVFGQVTELLCRHAGLATLAIAADQSSAERLIARAVTFVGAGIYEEVLFRLLLLPACYCWFRMLRAGPRSSAVLATLATSLMFALAHYIGPAGDGLVPYTFCFRAAAGVYFAALFVTRGFGITVGAHAIYDLIVGVLWVA